MSGPRWPAVRQTVGTVLLEAARGFGRSKARLPVYGAEPLDDLVRGKSMPRVTCSGRVVGGARSLVRSSA